MDQSNAPAAQEQPQGLPSDLDLRLTAIRNAVTVACAPNGVAMKVVDNSRAFYLLLAGRDPLVDLGVTEGNVTPIKKEATGG